MTDVVSPAEDTLGVEERDRLDSNLFGSVVLEADGLRREYGPVIAVDGIDLSLAEGEFLTIFGPNGAGKSSLLGMLAGAMRPTAGIVRVRGQELAFSDTGWRHRIGMLSHRGFLYGRLTAEENLRFYGSSSGSSTWKNVSLPASTRSDSERVPGSRRGSCRTACGSDCRLLERSSTIPTSSCSTSPTRDLTLLPQAYCAVCWKNSRTDAARS